jgi:hypothetical protein
LGVGSAGWLGKGNLPALLQRTVHGKKRHESKLFSFIIIIKLLPSLFPSVFFLYADIEAKILDFLYADIEAKILDFLAF